MQKSKMRALVYRGPKDVRLAEKPIPAVSDTDVLIKVLYCGVCGTDHHIYNGDGGAFAVKPPLVMGHEFSGIVEKIGSKVHKVVPGDLVTVDPNDMCGSCYFCKNAQEQFCTHNRGYGTTVDGGFAEYCAVNEKQVFKLKKETSALAAAMTEPVSCCLHGIDLCKITAGSEILIIGGGPIGMIMLQLARMSGACKIIVSEPVASKRTLAEKLGADITIDPIHENLEAVLKAHTQNISTVVECAGTAGTVESAVRVAGKGATVMLFGLTGPDVSVQIKPDVIFKKELKITSSFINPYTFARTVTLIESGRINLNDIITDVVAFEDAARIFKDPELRKKGKTVIKISG